MSDFRNKFTTFESTDAPPVVTQSYQDLKRRYESGFSEPLILQQAAQPSQKQEEQDNRMLYFEQEETYNPIQERTNPKSKPVDSKKLNGYSGFQQAMEKYEAESGDKMSPLKKKILSNIACLESGYRQTAKNDSSSALGYFLMIKNNRKDLGTDQDYSSNTNLQFRAASRLYDSNWRMIQPYWKQGQALGLTAMQMMYGMWFSPKSMIEYIQSSGRKGGNFRDAQGTPFLKVLQRALNIS